MLRTVMIIFIVQVSHVDYSVIPYLLGNRAEVYGTSIIFSASLHEGHLTFATSSLILLIFHITNSSYHKKQGFNSMHYKTLNNKRRNVVKFYRILHLPRLYSIFDR
jgi:hypothetical protein